MEIILASKSAVRKKILDRRWKNKDILAKLRIPKKYNIAFLGCGAMGTEIIDYVVNNLDLKFNIILLMDNNLDNAEKLLTQYNISPIITDDINTLLDLDNIDLIIETASIQAVKI